MRKIFSPVLLLCILSFPATAQHLISDSLIRSMTAVQVDSFRQAIFLPADSAMPINHGIDLYKITYSTANAQGTGTTTATGMLIIPNTTNCPMPIASYDHGTTANKNAVPSRQSLETAIGMLLAADGYVCTMPDYLGLGDSPGFHPYVHAKSEATATIDMILAAQEFAAANNVELNGQLFLTGYSQGGHAAMATHKEIQLNHPALTVTASAPLSGPYDISGVQSDLLTSNDPYPDPSYLPYVVLSYDYVYDLYDSIQEIFIPPYDSTIPPLFNGAHNTWDVNLAMPNVPKNIIIPNVFVAIGADTSHPFSVALRDNDTWKGWVPQAPVKMVYCEADDAVTYQNAIVARDHFIAAGATHVQAVSAGAANGHVGCRTPALVQAKLFFDSLKVEENNLVINLTSTPESAAGANDATVTAHISGGTGYTVQWGTGENDTVVTGLADGTYTVTVTTANGCSKVRSVSTTATGIANPSSLQWSVYPNPAENGINVQVTHSSTQPLTLTMYDVTGRVVDAMDNLAAGTFFVERGTLGPGIYILELKGEQVFRKKVVLR